MIAYYIFMLAAWDTKCECDLSYLIGTWLSGILYTESLTKKKYNVAGVTFLKGCVAYLSYVILLQDYCKKGAHLRGK